VPNVRELGVVSDAGGCLEVLATTDAGAASTLWHRRELVPSGSWSPWVGFPGMSAGAGSLAVAANPDGGMGVVVMDASKAAPWYAQRSWSDPAWSRGTSLRTPPTREPDALWSPALCYDPSGRPQLFVSDPGEKVVWHRGRTATGWSAWERFPSPGSPDDLFPNGITAARNVDGRLELFAVAGLADAPPRCEMWHRWQLSAGGPWAGWESLGTFRAPQDPVRAKAQANLDGRLEVFIAAGAQAWHSWQVTAGNPQSWTCWRSFEAVGGGSERFDTTVDGEGITVVTKSADGGLWVRTQALAGGGWQPWSRVDGQFIGSPGEPVVARGASGLRVFAAMNPSAQPFTGEICGYGKSPAGDWSLTDRWQRP
jgi:hypothetical protein